MLRLFSNIRKTLINEGKTSRYVRYAVGEVLLIMVGIILALQFQNWNEGRKLEQERRELIENLKVDFQTTLETLERSIERGDTIVEELTSFLSLVGGGEIENATVEELKLLAGAAFRGNPYKPLLGTYESAKSTGLLRLLKSSILNQLFVDFEKTLWTADLLRESGMRDFYEGSDLELRKQVGSLGLINGNFKSKPNPVIFQLTEEEYKEFVSRKDVYAAFENEHNLISAQRNQYRNLRETTQQILTALEALD